MRTTDIGIIAIGLLTFATILGSVIHECVPMSQVPKVIHDTVYVQSSKITITGSSGNTITQTQTTHIRDYNLTVGQNFIVLYDGNRPVGTMPLDNSSQIGKLILEDNQ